MLLLLFTPALPMQALQACNLKHRELVNSERRASSDCFQFPKRSQLFIDADDKQLSVVAMRISNQDRSHSESMAET